ncbi:MAG: glycosyltransferase family 4 protein [Ignavibacteriales bacterium]|nr:glycosyltransferase family 4 protein [Ignavibacteriales bacterium]
MNELRNILVIAYYFPPMGMSGVQRTLKFLKYLPQFGWKPTVLTVTPTGYFAQDESLLDEIKDKEIDIVRVGSLDPNWLFRKKGTVEMPSEFVRKIFQFGSDSVFIPDNKILWKNKALNVARELFQQKKFELVFATAPPWTDFLIGHELQKEFNVPLIIDYRDSWLNNPFKYYPTPLHRYLNFRLEKKVLKKATKILTTNRRVKELILKKHHHLSYQDIVILSQGFDPEDFPSDVSTPFSEKLKITHAGVFYGGRKPHTLLRGLQKLFVSHPKLNEKISVEFIGKEREEDKKLVEKMQLQNVVSFSGYVSHRECVQRLCTSDVLFLSVDNDTQSPGKVYEYLGARKPILANVPDGYLKQMIEDSGAGFIVAPNDIEGMSNTLFRLHQQFETSILPLPSEEYIMKFDRTRLTGELSRIFGFSLHAD